MEIVNITRIAFKLEVIEVDLLNLDATEVKLVLTVTFQVKDILRSSLNLDCLPKRLIIGYFGNYPNWWQNVSYVQNMKQLWLFCWVNNFNLGLSMAWYNSVIICISWTHTSAVWSIIRTVSHILPFFSGMGALVSLFFKSNPNLLPPLDTYFSGF